MLITSRRVAVLYATLLGVVTSLALVVPEVFWRAVAPLEYAEHVLRRSSSFGPPTFSVCEAWVLQTEAWQTIARAPDAARRFQRLAVEARPGGRLYGLAGLRHTDSTAFARVLPNFLNDTSLIYVETADLNGEAHELREVAREIAEGSVAARLATTPLVLPYCRF